MFFWEEFTFLIDSNSNYESNLTILLTKIHSRPIRAVKGKR